MVQVDDNNLILGTELIEPKIVGIMTQDKQLPVDYYLQMKGRSLMVFKDKTLNL